LKYRVPDSGPYPKSDAALQDAQRAVGIVRAHAAEWHVDPARVVDWDVFRDPRYAATPEVHYSLFKFSEERPRGIYWTPSPIFLHADACARFTACGALMWLRCDNQPLEGRSLAAGAGSTEHGCGRQATRRPWPIRSRPWLRIRTPV